MKIGIFQVNRYYLLFLLGARVNPWTTESAEVMIVYGDFRFPPWSAIQGGHAPPLGRKKRFVLLPGPHLVFRIGIFTTHPGIQDTGRRVACESSQNAGVVAFTPFDLVGFAGRQLVCVFRIGNRLPAQSGDVEFTGGNVRLRLDRIMLRRDDDRNFYAEFFESDAMPRPVIRYTRVRYKVARLFIAAAVGKADKVGAARLEITSQVGHLFSGQAAFKMFLC